VSALNLSRGARRGAVSSLRSRRLRRFALHAEPLELRQLLSVSTGGYTANAVSTEIVKPAITFSSLSGVSTPTGLSPSQIQTAYGVNQISFGSVIGNGAGQTIAIIDAYLDPNISSDLATFDSQYGLVAPPSFTQYVENGLGGGQLGLGARNRAGR
jgi:subtilase family serine protease